MTALALKALAAASYAGVAVTLDGDGLILDPSPSAELIAQLKAVKPDLLRILAGREAARAIINTAAPPPDCSEPCWEVARRGLRRFMKDGWGDQSALLGWTPEELYAVPVVWGRVDLCGAALLITDRRVVAITEGTIVIEGLSGSHLKFRRAGREHLAEERANSVLTGSGESAAKRADNTVERPDNAACMPLCIPARPEPARLEPVRPEPPRPQPAHPQPAPAAELSRLSFYEFFCGGGGAREGLSPQWSCAFANDIRPTKASSYTRNWGRDGFKLGDVARLKASDLPGQAALLWASFPCQDLSEAGAGAAPDGYRSNGLWPCFELIRGLRAEGRALRTRTSPACCRSEARSSSTPSATRSPAMPTASAW
jgi:C-5 cytosine-specific DNA methylase